MDLIEARQVIEEVVVGFAAERRSVREIEELKTILWSMQKNEGNYREFVETDITFHMKLADIAKNEILHDMLASIQSLLRTWILSVIEFANDTDFSYLEHQEILRAIETGDARMATTAMKKHMDSAVLHLKKALKGAEEEFAPEN